MTMSARDWLDEWAVHLRGTVRPNTARAYSSSVCLLFDHLGHDDVEAVRRRDIDAWLAELSEQGRTPATRALRLKAVRAFYAYVAAEEDISNPADGIAVPKVTAPRVDIPSDEAVSALLAACNGRGWQNRRDNAAIRLMASEGLRRGELVALDVDDVDPIARTCEVKNGKGGRQRLVTLSEGTALAVRRWLRARKAHTGTTSGPLLVGSKAGKRLTAGSVADMLARRCNQADIDPINPHALRHRAAHGLLAAGLGEQVVERQLGWRGGTMVRRYGAALADERARDQLLEVPDRL